MNVLILGGDGYLGWPTAMYLSARGHGVTVMDNYMKRDLEMEVDAGPLISPPHLPERSRIWLNATGRIIKVVEKDVKNFWHLSALMDVEEPDAIVHFAEQPSGPYSMMGYQEAQFTLSNNLDTTMALIWAVLEHRPDCHIIKLGTMGEYGVPGVMIPEGWMTLPGSDGSRQFLFPREAGSLYHTCKILETDLLHFYCRHQDLRVTDLMQGPVYGIATDEMGPDPELRTSFHYDDIFGTVLNRFIAQAVAGIPLTVYGKGGQTRGYLNLADSLRCIELAMESPPDHGTLRVMNQFTEIFSVNELAELVAETWFDRTGQTADVQHIENPRKEAEAHPYEVERTALEALGLEPTLLTGDVVDGMLTEVEGAGGRINTDWTLPRVRWQGGLMKKPEPS